MYHVSRKVPNSAVIFMLIVVNGINKVNPAIFTINVYDEILFHSVHIG